MTADQELHLERIKAEFWVLVDAKYRAGAAEHAHDGYGGELLNVPTQEILTHAIEEAIDQVVYLLSLKEKLHKEMMNESA